MKAKLLFVLITVFFLNVHSQTYLKVSRGNLSSAFISDGWAKFDFGALQSHVIYKTTNYATAQDYYGDSISSLSSGIFVVWAMNNNNLLDTLGVALFAVIDTTNSTYFTGTLQLDSIVVNSAPAICDGSAFFDVLGAQMSQYPGFGMYIGSDSINQNLNYGWRDSLCSGGAFVQIKDMSNNTYAGTTFYIGPVMLPTASYSPQVVTTTTTGGLCNASARAQISGGTAPFQYSWDAQSYSNTDSINALCTGMHNLITVDANSDTVSVYFIITDSTNSIVNTNPYGPALGTIVFNTSNCNFDYNLPVDSAFISSYTVIDTNTVFISWEIWQNGTLTQVSDTVSYTWSGVNAVQMDMFCGNGRLMTPGFNSFNVIDYINTSGATGIASSGKQNETGIKLYPNPFSAELSLEYYAEASSVNILITDVLGKTVYKNTLDATKGWNTFTVDGNGFDKGAYFVILNSNGKQTIKKVIK
ncbi:MAG: T9SS type A sorting domain-containing protein [Bacteroidia bacterium]